MRTEDGSAWTVFLSAHGLAGSGIAKMYWQSWAGGAKKLAAIAGRCTETEDPANKKYGIALPTAESVLTDSLSPSLRYPIRLTSLTPKANHP